MKDDVFARVVAVEKEIGQRVEREKVRAREWLEQLRCESEERIRREQRELEHSLRTAIDSARREAEIMKTRLLNEAREKAESLIGLSDDALKQIIFRHIKKILPGDTDDSKDVKA